MASGTLNGLNGVKQGRELSVLNGTPEFRREKKGARLEIYMMSMTLAMSPDKGCTDCCPAGKKIFAPVF